MGGGLETHIDEWNREADSMIRKALIEQVRGDLNSAEVWKRKAVLCRRTAQALTLEHCSGEPHCVDSLQPVRTCPDCKKHRGET